MADGKVYIGTETGSLWVLKAGKELQVLSKTRLKANPITLTAANGVLYIPTQQSLLAIPGKPARAAHGSHCRTRTAAGLDRRSSMRDWIARCAKGWHSVASMAGSAPVGRPPHEGDTALTPIPLFSTVPAQAESQSAPSARRVCDSMTLAIPKDAKSSWHYALNPLGHVVQRPELEG